MSPLTKRRNKRRREKFLAEKLNSNQVQSKPQEALEIQATDGKLDKQLWVSCDQCGHKTKTESGMKLHKNRKQEVPQVDANDTHSDSTIESDDENIEQTTKQPTASDVLMTLNSLASSIKDVNDHIKSIIK